jgi:hypothetical protein
LTIEASLHIFNSFITLTYDPDHLPKDGSLNVVHFQKFMKRLRKKISPLKIRFFHCGGSPSRQWPLPQHLVKTSEVNKSPDFCFLKSFLSGNP